MPMYSPSPPPSEFGLLGLGFVFGFGLLCGVPGGCLELCGIEWDGDGDGVAAACRFGMEAEAILDEGTVREDEELEVGVLAEMERLGVEVVL